jgi:hypothetical protein
MTELVFLPHKQWRTQPKPIEVQCDVPSLAAVKNHICYRAELLSSRLWRCWTVKRKLWEKVPIVEPTEGRVINVDHAVGKYRYVRRLIVVGADDRVNYLDDSLGDAVRVLRYSQSRIRFIDYLHVGIDGDGVLREPDSPACICPQGRSFIKPHRLLSIEFQTYAHGVREAYNVKCSAIAAGLKNWGGSWISAEQYDANQKYQAMSDTERRAFAAQQAKQK